MAILDLQHTHKDFIKDILPYTCHGIFIDTSIMKALIEGFINWKFSKTKDYNYQNLNDIFTLLHLKNWNQFFITPHILTEICHHFYYDNKRNKRKDFCDMAKSVIPILKDITEEKEITKEELLNLIDLNKPVIELGNISIFVAVDNIIKKTDKIAILSNNNRFTERYENHPNIMIIDYNRTILDLQQK